MRSNLGRTFRLASRGTIARIVSMTKSGSSIAGADPADPPGAPSGLSAISAGTTQIDLSWVDNATDESGWKIEQAPDVAGSPGTWAEIANLVGANLTSYSATGLSAGTKYHYRVRAYNIAGDSSYTSSASATTAGVPAAPTGFTATSTFADSVSLAWTDASSDETGFDIEVSTNAGSTYSSVTTTAANATSYSHTGRTESTAYLYRIRATNAGGSSSWVTASSVTTPAALTGLTATATSSTQINLAWTDKSGVETGFRIERSTDNTNWTLVTTTAANATSATVSGLSASTLYYIRVRANAYDGTNNSAWVSSSATTASNQYTVEYLTVGGGGGGGGCQFNASAGGGGGGAGGYKTATGFSLTVGTSYTITVGAGGAGGTATSSVGNRGTNGSNSVFSTITSTGGGAGGGAYGSASGNNGGSGGGAGAQFTGNASGGNGTSGEGNNGGSGGNTAGSSANYRGGGGGGADAEGTTGNGSVPNGGAGKANSITGSSVTYAGGGGGGHYNSTASRGAGGAGGGGNGGAASNGSNGSTNLGGGGGGAGCNANSANSTGGNGGSGVVILRMATSVYSGITTGSPSVTTSGSDTILTFNASGTYTA